MNAMNMEIYYYSGTGNSLHVARELQMRIPAAKLTAIVHSLRNGCIKTGAEKIGFVFPNFCLTLPIPVHDFLEKADLSSARYIFAICTRGGSQSEAFEYMRQMLKRKKKRLNAQLEVNMPWNHPVKENLPGLNSEERVSHMELVMQDKLDTFSQAIVGGVDYVQKESQKEVDEEYELSVGMRLFDLLIPKSLNYKSHEYMYQQLVHFYADTKCCGCGTCEKVCLSQKITITDGKPAWNKEVKCYACFACINYCPRKAIQVQSKFPIESNTVVNDRYHHERMNFKDIARQR
jgi:ferredoxin